MTLRAVIESVKSFLPETVLSNEQLAREVGKWSAEEILMKTGIRERRVAAPNECSSDLAVRAAQALIDERRLNPADVDYLLFCTQSPDYFLPATACIIQQRLGLPRTCGALDFNQGCSGYVFGLSIAKGLIESQQACCILLLTGETYSKYINAKDRSVRTLFGDAATATVVRAKETNEGGLGEFVFGSDGRGAASLIVPTGGMRNPRSSETAKETQDSDGNVRSKDNLYMNGPEIFRFAIQEVPSVVAALLDKSKMTVEDIDFLILHQANRFMLDQLVRKIRIPPERAPYEFEDVGNTVSSSIPITIERLITRNMLRKKHRLALVGFGVGYSWAANTLTWE